MKHKWRVVAAFVMLGGFFVACGQQRATDTADERVGSDGNGGTDTIAVSGTGADVNTHGASDTGADVDTHAISDTGADTDTATVDTATTDTATTDTATVDTATTDTATVDTATADTATADTATADTATTDTATVDTATTDTATADTTTADTATSGIDTNGTGYDWKEKIQLYGHGYSVPNQFTQEELEWIARTFKIFTVEKRHAYGTYGNASTEDAAVATAELLKVINPNIKVLMYWNEILTYSGLYETSSAAVAAHPEWLGADWTNVNGTTYTTWDLSVPGCQDFWVDAVSSTIERGLDGVFLDAAPKTHVRGLSEEASMLVDRIRSRVGRDKIVIFNGYRTNSATSMQAGSERMETASGVYVEFFLRTPCDTKEEAAFLFDNLIAAQQEGKFIVTRSSSKHGLPGAEDPFLFTFASFLLVYGPNTYWFYNDSYDKADWLYDYRPEYYDIATGASLGSAVRDGWVYTREFENISVRVDLENVTASIIYKNK